MLLTDVTHIAHVVVYVMVLATGHVVPLMVVIQIIFQRTMIAGAT